MAAQTAPQSLIVEKLVALTDYEADEWTVSTYDESLYEAGSEEYLVLTDSEADERTEEYIRENLWAFCASFLVNYMPEGVTEDVLEPMQEKKCEDANPAMLALVGDNLDMLIRDAIMTDGRGHFLAQYDSEEIDLGDDLYAYRTN